LVVKINFEGTAYLSDDDTVLDTLLNNKVSVPYSCKSGVCHCCMMKLVKGEVSGDGHKGLTEAQINAGFFLPCSCVASSDLVITRADDYSMDQQIKAEVIDKAELSDEIMRIRLKPQGSYNYKPGQFLNLFKDQNTVRSYSLASTPQLPYLELHVQRLPNGVVSRWLHDDVAIGDLVHISQPQGECYYRPGHEQKPILLVATGSGLAPLYAVLHQALASGHQGPIHLYHGSSRQSGVYLRDELKQLASKTLNFSYTPCLSRDAVSGFTSGRANEIALEKHPNLKGWLVFVCGHPDMVNDTRKHAFLAGASFSEIFAEAFKHP